MAQHRLFVYGSLLQGEPAHGYLRASPLLGRVATEAGYRLIDLGDYPGLVVVPGTEAVVGELYDVDTAVRDRLDAYEGHPALFCRTEIGLAGQGRAWAYLFRGDAREGVAVKGGDWRAARAAASSDPG